MKKISLVTIILILAVILAPVSSISADQIEIGIVEWPDALAPAVLTQQIAEDHFDKSVDITSVDKEITYLGVSENDFDMTFSVWMPNTDFRYVYEVKEGFEVLHPPYYYNALIGWYVPDYVDVESIEDLQDPEIADKFDNEVIGIDPGAAITEASEEALEAYDLEEYYDLVVSSEAAMMAEVDSAYRNEEPIIATLWRPHWAFADYDMNLLEDPKGIFGEEDNVHIGLNREFRQKYPELADALQRIDLNTPDIPGATEEMREEEFDYMAEMMLYGEEADVFEEGVIEWYEENQDIVEEWVNP